MRPRSLLEEVMGRDRVLVIRVSVIRAVGRSRFAPTETGG